jgi:hypothetical protein
MWSCLTPESIYIVCLFESILFLLFYDAFSCDMIILLEAQAQTKLLLGEMKLPFFLSLLCTEHHARAFPISSGLLILTGSLRY